VTTKVGALESKETLKRRIDEAARFIALDQLALSPQCGFSSTVDGNEIAVQAQRDKLARVIEVAAEVWGETSFREYTAARPGERSAERRDSKEGVPGDRSMAERLPVWVQDWLGVIVP